jgi:hypothetical protein
VTRAAPAAPGALASNGHSEEGESDGNDHHP